MRDNCALVETVDIITPLVDDPFTFGQIAAANSLSDVFAMGGNPVTAMNLLFFPSCSLHGEVLSEILAGGLEKVREAGACVVGGHTVDDDELKYGLSVTGLIDPSKIVRNSTARPGDFLVLTKPLGMGIVSTAIKADMVHADLVREACRWMTTLNSVAASHMLDSDASACTDVTGFGLIGHAVEMAKGADVAIRIRFPDVPVLPGVSELVGDGMVPAGCYRNRDYYTKFLRVGDGIASEGLLPLFDPQTSGGLLISLSPKSVEVFLRLSRETGVFAVVIGEVVAKGEFRVEVAT